MMTGIMSAIEAKNQSLLEELRAGLVISPFLRGCIGRIHAAIFSFMAGVMPPIPMFGRSLLYVQSHCVV